MRLKLTFLLVFGVVFSSVTPRSPDVEVSKFDNRDDGAHDSRSHSLDDEIQEEFYTGRDPDRPLRRAKRLTTWAPPKLSKSSETVGEGSKVTVVCTSQYSGLEWTKPNNKTIKEKSWLSSHIYVEKTKKGSYTSTLVIKDVELSDAGAYSCMNGTQSSSRAVFKLIVLPKPKPKLKPDEEDVNLDEGDTYIVTCSGNWRNVSWRNSNGLEAFTYSGGLNPVFAVPNPQTNSSVLTIKNATVQHNGKYYCRVSVQGTVKEKTLKVTVQPTKLYFIVKPSIAVKEENENFWLDETYSTDITCKGAVKNLNWKLNGADLTSSRSPRGYVASTGTEGRKAFSTIRFEYPRKNIEGGQYLCSGLSLFDNKKIEKKFYLKVKEGAEPPAPTLVAEKPKIEDNKVTLSVKQENYSIACVSSLDNLSWFGPFNVALSPGTRPFDARVYVEKLSDPTTGLRLVFNRPAVNDQGEYTCSGSRREKSRKVSVLVNIFEPAYFSGIQESPVRVNATGNVTLQCIVGGHPMPTVNWKFQDELIHNDPKRVYNGTSLTISNASWADSGRYACIAQQPSIMGTTIERTVDLVVLHKPWFPVQNETVERVLRTTASLRCDCYTTSNDTYYTWFRDGAILRTASGELAANRTKDIVEIAFSKPEHQGLYRCRAENPLGLAEMNITIIAMKPPKTPTITPTKATISTIIVQLAVPENNTITKYQISVKETNAANWTSHNYSAGTAQLYKVEKLKKQTEYTLKARAMNDVGFGNFSSEVKYSTSIGVRLSVSIASWFSIFAVIVLNVSSNRHSTA